MPKRKSLETVSPSFVDNTRVVKPLMFDKIRAPYDAYTRISDTNPFMPKGILAADLIHTDGKGNPGYGYVDKNNKLQFKKLTKKQVETLQNQEDMLRVITAISSTK